MKNSIAYTFILLLLWSCGAPDEVFYNPIRVDIDERHDMSIFDIFERIEIIPLETIDESIFRRINKLIYHKGFFYILDFTGDKILAFDSAGKFLFKIDDRGQGPMEYISISDFDIDKQNNTILVLDPHGDHLMEYDLSGNFLQRTRLPTLHRGAYRSLRYLGNGIIAFYTFDDTNRLKFFDRNNKSIFREHFPKKVRSMLDHFPVEPFSYVNRMMRESALDNRVFEIFPDGTYSVAYTWDFGGLNNRIRNVARRFPPGQNLSIEERTALAIRMWNSEIVNYYFLNFGGNQTFRYAQVARRGRAVNIFHKISENRNFVFAETIEGAHFYPIFWSDEFVIGLGGHNDDQFWRAAPEAIFDEKNLEIKRSIDEFDNPVLIKYHFRK